jgi:hypothetical protein
MSKQFDSIFKKYIKENLTDQNAGKVSAAVQTLPKEQQAAVEQVGLALSGEVNDSLAKVLDPNSKYGIGDFMEQHKDHAPQLQAEIEKYSQIQQQNKPKTNSPQASNNTGTNNPSNATTPTTSTPNVGSDSAGENPVY